MTFTAATYLLIALALLTAAPRPCAAMDSRSSGTVTAVDRVDAGVARLLDRIRDAGERCDMDDFARIASDAQGAQLDDSEAAQVMKALCERLTACKPDGALNDRRRELIESCAEWALSLHPSMPLADQAYFTTRPMISDELVEGGAWAVRRRARASAWISLWRRLDAASQRDAETAMAAHYFADATEAFLVASYSREPYGIDELRQMLTAPFIGPELRWRVLGKVLYRMDRSMP